MTGEGWLALFEEQGDEDQKAPGAPRRSAKRHAPVVQTVGPRAGLSPGETRDNRQRLRKDERLPIRRAFRFSFFLKNPAPLKRQRIRARVKKNGKRSLSVR
jgi:hypothetical protein